MNVLAINSSPRAGDQSKTELMLTHLVQGMRDAGAAVQIVDLRKKNIKHCIGCFTCWTKTPGKCLHKDDMSQELFPRWLESDLVVYAFPLYFHSMNAAMRRFVERTLPAALPFFNVHQGKVFHPLRVKVPAMVFLSVCGFPDDSEFDALSDFLNHTSHKDVTIAAEIYRSAAETMTHPIFEQQKNDILNATKLAGQELVETGKVSSQTLDRIKQPFIDVETFTMAGNVFWKTCIDEGVTPKEFAQKEMVPRPDSVESFMLFFSRGLNAQAVGDKKAFLQFHFSDEAMNSCYFTIQTEHVEAAIGKAKSPDITIETPFELWMDIMTGKADGQAMFLEQKYKVTGDLSLMLQLFRRQQGLP